MALHNGKKPRKPITTFSDTKPQSERFASTIKRNPWRHLLDPSCFTTHKNKLFKSLFISKAWRYPLNITLYGMRRYKPFTSCHSIALP